MAGSDGFIDKFILSFSIRAMLFKAFTGFILVLAFNLEGLRIAGDKVFRESTGSILNTMISFDMISALWHTYREAVIKAIASLYPVFNDFISGNMELVNTSSYFSLGFALLIFIVLMFQYQSFVALIMNFFVPDWSDTVMFGMSMLMTGAIILIMSVFTTIILGVQPTLFTDIIRNETSNIVNNITNSTTSGGFVIDLT